MTITKAQYPIDLRAGADPRTPGIHLSGILQALGQITGVLDEEEQDLSDVIRTTPLHEVGDNSKLMLITTGLMWESWLGPRLPRVCYHPGEIEHEGILMTPDGVEFIPGARPKLHEIKATFKSAKRLGTDDGFPMWMWQAAGYCKGASEAFGEEILSCVFHPLFLKGYYDSRFPLYLPFEVVFEREEIQSYWQMISQHKHLAKPEN